MNKKLEKINSQIMRFLAYEIRVLDQDNISSITQVESLSDLSLSKIFIETSDDSKEVIDRLNSLSKSFRYKMAQKLKLRRTPELLFVLDLSASQYQKIDRLLRK